MKYREVYLSQLAAEVKSKQSGNDIIIDGLGFCNRSTSFESVLAFTTSADLLQSAIENTSIKALVTTCSIAENAPQGRFSFILCDFPEETFYAIHHFLFASGKFYDQYNFEPIVGSNCLIHSTAVIEKGVRVEDNVTIGANSVIKKGTIIKQGCNIGCCSVIGSEGFQALRRSDGSAYTIIHVGGTVLDKNVFVGDNVTICNSLFEGMVTIGENTKIDSHCYIAHNCIIGKNSFITAGVIVMGSAIIGDNVWLAPGAIIMNRIIVNSDSKVGANSFANKDIKSHTTVVGTPAEPIEEFVEKKVAVRNLLIK